MSADPLIGKSVGNYVVASLLQEGGMGKVYVGEHPEIGRRVAIKVISPEHTARPGIAERFLAEAKAISRIKHPNIVDIYDFGRTDDDRLYYTMELLEGRDLDTVMSKRGPLSPADAVPFVKGICAGLQAAHKKGVIHRDLKPGNIFVLETEPQWIKILDFGLAKLLEAEGSIGTGGPSLTSTGMVMGTPFTIAPEQAAGRTDQIGPHTDLYSLGVIIYWMLSGRPPFKDEPTPIILAKHIQDPPPPLRLVAPTVSESVAEVVEGCLCKDPQMRPDSATELAQDYARAALADQSMVEPTDKMKAVPPAAEPSKPTTAPEVQAPRTGQLIEATGSAEEPKSGESAPARQTGPTSRPSSEPSRNQATDLPLATTLDGNTSADDLLRAVSPGYGRKKWLALGIAGVLLALVGLLWNRGDNPPSPVANEQPSPLESPANRSTPGSRAKTTAQQLHTITVLIEDNEATCTTMVGNRDPRKQRSPCLIRVPHGEWLTLEVARPGYRSFVKRWAIQTEETLQLRSDARVKLIAVVQPTPAPAPAPPASTKAAANSPATRQPVAKKARSTRRKASPRKRSAAPKNTLTRRTPPRTTPPKPAPGSKAPQPLPTAASGRPTTPKPADRPVRAAPKPRTADPSRPPTDNVDPWDN